jgi:transcriptional regulator with XRE-family HTH domain
MTQHELALRVGVCAMTIGLYERGNHPPGRKRLRDLAAVLGKRLVTTAAGEVSEP